MLHHYTNLQNSKLMIQIYLYLRKKQNFHPYVRKKNYQYSYIYRKKRKVKQTYIRTDEWKFIIEGNEAWSENTLRFLTIDNLQIKKKKSSKQTTFPAKIKLLSKQSFFLNFMREIYEVFSHGLCSLLTLESSPKSLGYLQGGVKEREKGMSGGGE